MTMNNIESIRRVFRDVGLYHHAADDRLCEELAKVRYDLSAAETEGAIRDKLIELGWTPPDAAQTEPLAWQYRRNDAAKWVTIPHRPNLLGDGDARRPLYAGTEPQVSAEDVEMVEGYLSRSLCGSWTYDAWKRIRASLEVKP